MRVAEEEGVFQIGQEDDVGPGHGVQVSRVPDLPVEGEHQQVAQVWQGSQHQLEHRKVSQIRQPILAHVRECFQKLQHHYLHGSGSRFTLLPATWPQGMMGKDSPSWHSSKIELSHSERGGTDSS